MSVCQGLRYLSLLGHASKIHAEKAEVVFLRFGHPSLCVQQFASGAIRKLFFFFNAALQSCVFRKAVIL